MMDLVWFLVTMAIWTLLVRLLLSGGVKLLGRFWSDTLPALKEIERYGWWISLVFGAIVVTAF